MAESKQQRNKNQVKEKAGELAQTITAGFQAATEGSAAHRAPWPCSDLLKRIATEAAKNKYNVDTLLEAEGIDKPGRAQRVGKTIDLIEKIAAESGNQLTIMEGRPCYYNGKFWEPVNDLDLGYFFTMAAQALGVQQYEARYCDFIRKAAESFKLSSRAQVTAKAEGVTLLNCLNGTVEITPRGARIREHRASDGLMYVLPYSYDPNAKAPTFAKFLEEVLPLEADRLNCQEFCGTIFTNLKSEKILYLYGATGNNGKTTFKDIICEALGSANTTSSSLDQLTDTGSTGEVTRAALEGKLLNACGELDHKINNSDILKKLATREELTVRLPHEKIVHNIQAGSYARLMFCCNYLPVFTKGAAKAEQRRFLFIGFEKEIAPKDINYHLLDDITGTELPGVLNWIIEGVKRLYESGGKFTPNRHADAISNEFLEGANSVTAYLNAYGLKPYTEANLSRFNGQRLDIDKGQLYNNRGASFSGPYGMGENIPGQEFEHYVSFCRSYGLEPKGRNTFFQNLRQFGFEERHTKTGDVVRLYQISEEERAKLRADRDLSEKQQELF